jgi:DNA-binding beta-propeller fold protein YncE
MSSRSSSPCTGTFFIRTVLVLLAASFIATAAYADDFVNFESAQTRPLALSPDGALLFAVNTPDGRLSVFEVGTASLTLAAEIPVGLEPIAVASRVNATTGKLEAWVVNLLSDSVSIVEIDTGDLTRSHVVRTLLVGDEPRDVVFAGSGTPRAFVTTARRGQNLPASVSPRLFDEGVPRALVWVFAAEHTGAGLGGTPLTILELFGDSPRALAASPDGSTVYAAIYHSGNRTASLAGDIALANGPLPPLPPDSPYVNDGNLKFLPLIVHYDPLTGDWNDVVDHDWSSVMKFTLPDEDVFVIDADANPPALSTGIDAYTDVGTTIFNMAVRPGSGSVFVTNTEAKNRTRFELASVGGVQGHLHETRVTVLNGISVTPVHVNPHIDYGVPTGPPAEIAESLAQLTDATFSSDGATLYAAAVGSNRVAVFDAAALEAGSVVRDFVEVGRGPTGVALDEARDQLYVMNFIDHTISIVTDVASPASRAESAVVDVGWDPTPAAVTNGRPFLYEARTSSGHGDAACASCHVFGDLDHLAWDLGDPYGPLVNDPLPVVETTPPGGGTAFFNPVKGPMMTQSLRGMAPGGSMHWRGDRTMGNDPGGDYRDAPGAFKKFNPAFVTLLGRSAQLTAPEMQAFTDFAMTLQYPPNPIRGLDNVMTDDEEDGRELFTDSVIVGLGGACNTCHRLPLGTSLRQLGGVEVAHLRNVYTKVGRFGDINRVGGVEDPFLGEQVRGYGLLHGGSDGGLQAFVEELQFSAANAVKIAKFVFGLDTGLRPIVGQQATRTATSSPATEARIDLLRDRAEAGDCDLTVAADVDGVVRVGVVTPDGDVRLDRDSAPLLDADAFAALAAASGAEQTYTCRPPGTGYRASIDRDGDGILNGDEIDEGTDPFDAASVPYTCGAGSATISAAKITIAKNDAPSGNETLSLKALVPLPPGWPALDVAERGLNLVFRDGAGRLLLHRRIFGVAVDKGPGWKVSGGGAKSTYKSKGNSGGILKAAVAIVKGTTIKVDIKGKASDFRLIDDHARLELVLGGDAEAAAGLCAVRAYGSGGVPPCVLKGKTLKCA